MLRRLSWEVAGDGFWKVLRHGTLVGQLVKAKPGAEKDNDWNKMNIEHRNGMVRVKLNDQLVAERARDANRASAGPIGFQLHDKYSVVMFRNPRIREFKK